MSDELLEVFAARRCPNYGELRISFSDVFPITSLPITGDMYDEFFLNNNIIINKNLPHSLKL